jgi:hypothetical protein
VSHANAPLTERGRLRLARCVVEDGWPLRRAAERFQLSPTTAQRWAGRYRADGPAAMADRSSRPHRSPTRTPGPVERKVLHLWVKKRWGPARIASRQIGNRHKQQHRAHAPAEPADTRSSPSRWRSTPWCRRRRPVTRSSGWGRRWSNEGPTAVLAACAASRPPLQAWDLVLSGPEVPPCEPCRRHRRRPASHALAWSASQAGRGNIFAGSRMIRSGCGAE